MIKRLVAAFLAASMAALCACGDEQVIHEQAEQTEITLSWWGNDARHEYTLAAVNKFQEKYPYIKVKCSYSEWSGYEARSRVQMVSGTEADVMQINVGWLSQYSEDGSGYYDLQLKRGGTTIKEVSAYNGTSYNFYPYMATAGKYTLRVRAVPHSTSQKAYAKSSAWVSSDALTISSSEVSNGAGADWDDIITTGENGVLSDVVGANSERFGDFFVCGRSSPQRALRCFFVQRPGRFAAPARLFPVITFSI